MNRNVINILGVSEPEHGGQPRSELGGQPGRNMQQVKCWDEFSPYLTHLLRPLTIRSVLEENGICLKEHVPPYFSLFNQLQVLGP